MDLSATGYLQIILWVTEGNNQLNNFPVYSSVAFGFGSSHTLPEVRGNGELDLIELCTDGKCNIQYVAYTGGDEYIITFRVPTFTLYSTCATIASVQSPSVYTNPWIHPANIMGQEYCTELPDTELSVFNSEDDLICEYCYNARMYVWPNSPRAIIRFVGGDPRQEIASGKRLFLDIYKDQVDLLLEYGRNTEIMPINLKAANRRILSGYQGTNNFV